MALSDAQTGQYLCCLHATKSGFLALRLIYTPVILIHECCGYKGIKGLIHCTYMDGMISIDWSPGFPVTLERTQERLHFL